MSMISYIIRRLLTLLPVLFGTLTLIFILSRFMPGDPAYSFLPQNFTYEQYLTVRRWLGLDRPLIVQYFGYIGDLFSGNWGTSIRVSNGTPVWQLIWQRFPRTMELSIFSILIASFVGIKAGVI
ncbi:MAG: peptide ABC transporter permease, partial [Candidatus Hodarchaeota archaeon]